MNSANGVKSNKVMASVGGNASLFLSRSHGSCSGSAEAYKCGVYNNSSAVYCLQPNSILELAVDLLTFHNKI